MTASPSKIGQQATEREGFTCNTCGGSHVFTQSERYFFSLGLLPIFCQSCRCLRITAVFPAIKAYVLGKQ